MIYNKLDSDTQVIVIASNSINKKNLKTILTKQNVASIFVTHPRFKYKDIEACNRMTPIPLLSERDKQSGLRYPYEKTKQYYKKMP